MQATKNLSLGAGTMQFGLYLVRKDIIDTNQFVEALRQQLASRPQLGTLAIESGKLTVKQVFQILREQNARPEELFGELAVEAGFITEEELAGLIYVQSLRVQKMVDILVEQGHLMANVADEHRAAYRKENQRTEKLQPVEAG